MTGRALEVLGPSTGGIRRHVATLADGLDRRGWTTSAVGPAGSMDGLRDSASDGVAPVRLGLSGPAAVQVLRPLVRKADIVHAHGLTAGWLAWAAGAGPKLVVTVHNLVLDEAAGHAAKVLRRLEGWLPSRARRTIVISEEMRGRFDPAGRDESLVVIPPVGPVPVVRRSVAAVRDELDVPAGTPLVLLVGRLHPQKGIETLIAAAADIDPDAQVVVAGDGPLRDELADQITRLELEGRVRLIGARSDAADLMAAADVVVVASIWEGFGLVAAEALFLARPVVATAVGPIPTMVVDEETGRLVPPSDPPALAGAVNDLLRDPSHAAALGRAGAKLIASHFDTDALIDRVEAVYRSVVKQPQP